MEISEQIQDMIMNRLKNDASIQSEKAKKAIKANTLKEIIKYFGDEQTLYENQVIPAVIQKIKDNPEDKAIKRSVISIIKGDISEKFKAIADDYSESFNIQTKLDDFTNKVGEHKNIEEDAKKIREAAKQRKQKQEEAAAPTKTK